MTGVYSSRVDFERMPEPLRGDVGERYNRAILEFIPRRFPDSRKDPAFFEDQKEDRKQEFSMRALEERDEGIYVMISSYEPEKMDGSSLSLELMAFFEEIIGGREVDVEAGKGPFEPIRFFQYSERGLARGGDPEDFEAFRTKYSLRPSVDDYIPERLDAKHMENLGWQSLMKEKMRFIYRRLGEQRENFFELMERFYRETYGNTRRTRALISEIIPNSPCEESIRRIWSEIMGLRPQTVATKGGGSTGPVMPEEVEQWRADRIRGMKMRELARKYHRKSSLMKRYLDQTDARGIAYLKRTGGQHSYEKISGLLESIVEHEGDVRAASEESGIHIGSAYKYSFLLYDILQRDRTIKLADIKKSDIEKILSETAPEKMQERLKLLRKDYVRRFKSKKTNVKNYEADRVVNREIEPSDETRETGQPRKIKKRAPRGSLNGFYWYRQRKPEFVGMERTEINRILGRRLSEKRGNKGWTCAEEQLLISLLGDENYWDSRRFRYFDLGEIRKEINRQFGNDRTPKSVYRKVDKFIEGRWGTEEERQRIISKRGIKRSKG